MKKIRRRNARRRDGGRTGSIQGSSAAAVSPACRASVGPTFWRHYFDPLEHREMGCACILLLQRHTNDAPVKTDLKSPLQPMCETGQISESTLSIQLINCLGGSLHTPVAGCPISLSRFYRRVIRLRSSSFPTLGNSNIFATQHILRLRLYLSFWS
jgi:hypothetical protein